MCLGAPLPWQRAGDHQFLLVNIWGANLESLSSPLEEKKDLVNSECFSMRRPCVCIMSQEFTRTLICQACGWCRLRTRACVCVFQLFLLYLQSAVPIMQLWLEAYHNHDTPCISPLTCDSCSRAVEQTDRKHRAVSKGHFDVFTSRTWLILFIFHWFIGLKLQNGVGWLKAQM